MAKRKSLLGRLLIWRVRHVSHRNFIILISILVGFTTGLAAVVIKNSVYFIRLALTSGFAEQYQNYLYFTYPLAGILLTVVFIKYVIRRPIRHGVPNTLYAISKNNSIMPKHNTWSSVVTSSLTVGFGGSVGLEGPTVATGAALGSNIGRVMHLNYKNITLLMGCGAAGAMASIFNAPIAAIVFAIEVIMLDLTMASLIPLLLASVSAAITSLLLMESEVLFHYDLKTVFTLKTVPFYVMLGILCGLVSLYFSRMFWSLEKLFERSRHTFRKAIGGGLLLGVMIFLFPPLYGEGYHIINQLIAGEYGSVLNNSLLYDMRNNMYAIFLFLFAVLMLKIVAMSVTFGSGGVGGIFAPTLFMGGLTGFIFSKGINELTIFHLEVSNFILVGMAGLIAGVLQAPLTAIFLIAELTGGYNLFMPLMITAAISYVTIRYFIPHSVYTMQLARRGELITHHKDKAVLTRMKMESVLESDFEKVLETDTLGSLVETVARSKRNIFPVVDASGVLTGVVTLDDIRDVMFKPAMYGNVTVQSLMHVPPAWIYRNDSMEEVTRKFTETGAWNLPVVERGGGMYKGFISKSKLFSSYRRQLIEVSED